MLAVGSHFLLDLYGCPAERLDDPSALEAALRAAADAARSTLLDLSLRRFDPQGVTAVCLLAESHIALHTWPEHGYAAADVFTCGQACDPAQACRVLEAALGARHARLRRFARGPAGAGLDEA